MRFSINIEFTDDEIKNHAADVGRRVGLGFIHDVITHIPALGKINPDVVAAAVQGIAAAFVKKSDPGPTAGAEKIDAEFEPPNGDLGRCAYYNNGNPRDTRWRCCKCGYGHKDHVRTCGECGHDRCDVIVTPPPQADRPLPEDPGP